jgi:prepilin-type N-terminal cleavage/methylation domain-containing protein
MKRYSIKRPQSGFTLVELTVVIAVLGMLMSIALPNLNSTQASARDAQRRADLTSYRIALERYFNLNASYPIGSDEDYRDTSGPSGIGIFAASSPLIAAGFMPAVVRDPVNAAVSGTALYYRYLSDDRGLNYVLYARLESGSNTWWLMHANGTSEGSSNEPSIP